MNLVKGFMPVLLFCISVAHLHAQYVFINEFMATNKTTITDEAGNFDDWVEIYNQGAEAYDISGKFITDDLTVPDKWQIPYTESAVTVIPPGGYLILWLDGDEDQGPLHVPFKLSSNGEQIGLFDSDGISVLDSLSFQKQQSDVSEGRTNDGSPDFTKFNAPSPGKANHTDAPEEVAPPYTLSPRGIL